MEPTHSSKPSINPRFRRIATRTSGLVVLAGLATGGGFAAVSGISSAASSSSSTSTASSASTSSKAATSASSSPSQPSGSDHGKGGYPGFGGGRGGFGGFGGAGGTITAIDGTTLTLRTEQGTETVKTTAKTTYQKEQVASTFAALHVGDVVRVRVPQPSSTATAPKVGTGTVTATEIDVTLPTLTGRVSAINGDTYTLVGPDGQLRTVSTTGDTRYYDGTSKKTASIVKVGSYVMAEGAQDTLTHLQADTVSLAPKMGERGPR